ncbi:hypothetical protein [Streptomyces sp. NBC_01089]|uniref:hypothetical protein n=1 Tax=Streptomyces sp. NBC_01089 TaxID=2903747 RepID=UPI0038631915|nr:hypothetical protein OG510_31930 [Streptomyces sp. NBC_01089]
MEWQFDGGVGATLATGRGDVRLTARSAPADPGTTLVCSPVRARELAAALLRAADEAERAQPVERVSVAARELRRGDVRDSDRSMTVERVRVQGDTVQVTWRSDTGRSWTQEYAAGTDIGLRRRA